MSGSFLDLGALLPIRRILRKVGSAYSRMTYRPALAIEGSGVVVTDDPDYVDELGQTVGKTIVTITAGEGSIGTGVLAITDSTTADGDSTSAAPANHQHAHGNRGGGTLHADVVTGGASGFMTGTQASKLGGIAAGATNDTAAIAALVAADTSLAAADTALGVRASALEAGAVRRVRATTVEAITLSGEQTIDGVAVVTGDRVLVRGQVSAATNGIYVVSSGAWTRATDFDATAEVLSGLLVTVSEGTAKADSLWMLTTNAPITLGATSLAFAQLNGSGGSVDFAAVQAALAAASGAVDLNGQSLTDVGGLSSPSSATWLLGALQFLASGAAHYVDAPAGNALLCRGALGLECSSSAGAVGIVAATEIAMTAPHVFVATGAAPGGNPTGGAFLWYDGTNFKFRRADGTVLTLTAT